MNTEIIRLDTNSPDMDKLAYAAKMLRDGGLVAFPTETVYGLGASALNEAAVRNIFTAKGRPSDNPLIVHISKRDNLSSLVSSVPKVAAVLIDAFWPGPLTLIMPKSASIPGIITAGLDTVAVRMPSHPIALALIDSAGVPVAAPSANSSGKPSPTLAQHVIDDLFGRIDVIIDGGRVDVGLESTVLDITADTPVILRPGGVTREQLERILGRVDMDSHLLAAGTDDTRPRSPGMKYRHYAPRARVTVVEGTLDKVVEKVGRLAGQYVQSGIKTGILATDETRAMYTAGTVFSMGSRHDPGTIAANLFDSLRRFDSAGVEVIIAEAVDGTGLGFAVMNRLKKAAGGQVIKV